MTVFVEDGKPDFLYSLAKKSAPKKWETWGAFAYDKEDYFDGNKYFYAAYLADNT